MTRYKNFKLVHFCTTQNLLKISEKALRRQLAFFEKYVGCDKVYIEPYRDGETLEEDQLKMVKRVFEENKIEVAGAITTTCNNLSEGDADKYRFAGTYCFVNEKMRAHLVEKVEYIARHFDEFIIDDWFFTYCSCHECRTAKGSKSWEDFRTALMDDVSKNLVIAPAKRVNPNIKIIIKFPNWVESYQESGYNPDSQRKLYEYIYTGTETRNTPSSDQHLPRYLAYSLTRLMENYAPGRNMGCWFDPYGCSPIDIYLEQGYLSAFAKPKELTLFCWGSLYKNRVITPLGLQLEIIDKFLSQTGNPIGTPCYLPCMAQGEDHLEDFLGMAGVPLELVPDFPENAKAVFLTLQAHKDAEIMRKLEKFVAGGGKAIVTAGFIIRALEKNDGITDMTSIRYNGRRVSADQFRGGGFMSMFEAYSRHKMTFPLLEHRTNTTWCMAKVVVGEENYPIILRDHYGKGQLITVALPDEYGYIYDLPAELLNHLRGYFTDHVPVSLRGAGQASLFAYDNGTFAVYKYVDYGLTRGAYKIAVKGRADSLTRLHPMPMELQPLQTITPRGRMGGGERETLFDVFLSPGELNFYKINWSEAEEEAENDFQARSAPHDFVDEDED